MHNPSIESACSVSTSKSEPILKAKQELIEFLSRHGVVIQTTRIRTRSIKEDRTVFINLPGYKVMVPIDHEQVEKYGLRCVQVAETINGALYAGVSQLLGKL